MKQLLILSSVLLALAACNGPPASDSAICSDLANRICAQPVCQVVRDRLKPGADCAADLSARVSCEADDFTWGTNGTPDRDRILDCRLPLIRNGDSVTNFPSCDQIEETFDRCPDIEQLFDGGTR